MNPLLQAIVKPAYKVFVDFFSDLFVLVIHLSGFRPKKARTSWGALQQWRYDARKSERSIRGKKILVFAFRNKTWIEWAVFSAHKFYSMGYEPIILFSSEDVHKNYPNRGLFKGRLFNFWKSTRKSRYITFIEVEKALEVTEHRIENKYHELASDFAHTLAAYNLRVEEYEEDVFQKEYQEEYEKAYKMLKTLCPSLESILVDYPGARIVCPNGLIEKSILFHLVSKRINLDIVFVEGWARRLGHMIWGFNNPVMFYDVMGWKKQIGPWDDLKEKDYRAMINFQNLDKIADDEWFEGFIPVQRSASGENLPEDFTEFLKKPGKLFLLGTNVIGDSATLRRGGIFRNQKEWLRELIPFIGQQTNIKMVIRIHPDEVFPKAKVKLGEIISKEVSKYPNIYLFKADNDINTNTLIDLADAGLAWVSNLGVDMVLRGKIALIAGKSNYQALGVGLYAAEKKEYFEKILELVKISSGPDPGMIENAKIYQRIVFKEMSLDATAWSYDGKDYCMSGESVPKQQHLFFKILSGEADPFSQKLTTS